MLNRVVIQQLIEGRARVLTCAMCRVPCDKRYQCSHEMAAGADVGEVAPHGHR
jgi:hypothetical protein